MRRTWLSERRSRGAAALTVGVLVGVMVLPSPASAGTSLVRDGAFERPRIQGDWVTFSAGMRMGPWTVSAGSVDLIRTYWVSFNGHQSIDLSGYEAGTIYQDVATVPGTTYRVRFALAGGGEPPVVHRVTVSFGSASQSFSFDNTGHSYQDMGWTVVHFDAVATDTTTRLEFKSLDDSNAGPAIDAVRVTVEG